MRRVAYSVQVIRRMNSHTSSRSSSSRGTSSSVHVSLVAAVLLLGGYPGNDRHMSMETAAAASPTLVAETERGGEMIAGIHSPSTLGHIGQVSPAHLSSQPTFAMAKRSSSTPRPRALHSQLASVDTAWAPLRSPSKGIARCGL